MRKLLKKFYINDNIYLFNGVNYDLFKVTDEEAVKKYASEEDEIVSLRLEKNQMSKVVFNFSNSCNLKCRYCYADSGIYASKCEELMTQTTFDILISQIQSNGINNIGVVSFFGGEPLKNYELIKYALPVMTEKFEVGIFEIVTNAWFVTLDKLELLNKYNVHLVFSCDGPKDITDYLRGDGTYDKIISSMELAHSIGYKNLSMSATYTKKHEEFGYSYKDLEDFFSKMNIQATISSVLSSDVEMIPKKRYTLDYHEKEMEQDIKKILQNKKVGAVNPFLYRTLLSLSCDAHSINFCDDLCKEWQISYDYDGSAYNCFHFWGNSEYKLTTNESTVKSIYDKNNKDNILKCKDCWAKYFCKVCTAAVMQGTYKLEFDGENCTDQKLYEIAMRYILKCNEEGNLKLLLNNFYDNFFTYKM